MNNTNRDICGGCQKQIYTHNKIIVCNACSAISHFDCSQTSMFKLFQNATVTSPAVWHCSDCSRQHGMVRYNPFLEVLSSPDGDDTEWGESADICKMSEALQNCKAFETVNEFNRDFFRTSKENNKSPFSVFFNNPDGNSTNFDSIAVEIKNSTINCQPLPYAKPILTQTKNHSIT